MTTCGEKSAGTNCRSPDRQTATIDSPSGHPATCKPARRLLVCVAAASCLLVLALAGHLLGHHRDEQEAAEKWMHALALSAPALWSAGSPMRHPETVHSGVDLRFAAGVEILP